MATIIVNPYYVSGGGGGSWDPTNLSGLNSFFDFSDWSKLYEDQAGTDPVDIAGDLVLRAENQNYPTNGFYLSRASASAPTLAADSIDFTSSNKLLSTFGESSFAQPGWVVVGFKFNAAATAYGIISTSPCTAIRYNGTSMVANGGSNLSLSWTSDTNAHVCAVNFNGSSSEIFIDGSSLGTGNAGTGNLQNGSGFIGYQATNGYLDGNIYFIITGSGTLGGTDLTNISTWASSQYADL